MNVHPYGLPRQPEGSLDVRLEKTRSEFRLSWPVGGERPVAVLDFGPECEGGYPAFTASGVEGEPVVRVSYCCHPDGLCDTGDFTHETRATYLGPEVDLPILPASTNRHDLFRVAAPGRCEAALQQGLVRYVRFTLDTPGTAVTIGGFALENRGTHAAEPPAGSFSCSDPALEALWRASVRTCQLAAIPSPRPYLSDGAKRDRLVWSGDLWFAQRNMYAAWGPESPYMPGSLRMLADNQTADGYIQACPYPDAHGPLAAGDCGPFPSDEFAAWFVPVLWDHLLYTGDFALARELYPSAIRLMAYLRARTGGDGIFLQRPETSKHAAALVFGAESTHRRAYMNILLWLVRRDMALLSRALGRDADAADFEREAEATARAVRGRFLLPGSLFALSLEKPDQPDPAAAALALAAGFYAPDEAAAALARTPRIDHGKFQLLLVRGAFRYGMPDEALRRIRQHNWLHVVDPAWPGPRLTSECMGLHERGWGDEAHPDTALAGELSFGLLGLRPVSPGVFAREPRPVPGLEASGFVPVASSLRRGDS